MKLRELLGPPPLLRSEKHKFYNEVLARLTQCLQPRDWMEQILVQNLADCTWEMARYTRHKALTMERGFNDDADFPAHDALARELAAARRRRADAYEVLEEQDPVALELDYAQALKVSMDNHEGVEKLLNAAMARRNDVLKQLDRYRNGLAQPLRQASDEMIAGEYAAVESSAPEIEAPLLALEEQEEEDE